MRVMRIFVMFDLPTGSKSERRSYAEFRKFLLNEGYMMEQFSVYTRATLGIDNMHTHIDRIKRNLPEAGRVTVIALTESQYNDRLVLRGDPRPRMEDADLGENLTLSF